MKKFMIMYRENGESNRHQSFLKMKKNALDFFNNLKNDSFCEAELYQHGRNGYGLLKKF